VIKFLLFKSFIPGIKLASLLNLRVLPTDSFQRLQVKR